MARLFLTLYLGVIATGFILLVFTSAVIDDIELEYDHRNDRAELGSYIQLLNQLSHQKPADAMYAEVAQIAALNAYKAELIDADDTRLNAEIHRQITQQQVAITGLEDEGNEAFWFRLDNGQYYRITADIENQALEEPVWIDQLILSALLAAPALAALLWIFSLQRKLSRLERAALSIADGNLSQRAPDDFGNRVGSLNRSFNRMAEHSEQLIASHKRLTNAVAHELRSPLFRIRCQLDMLHDPEADAVERDMHYQGASEDLDELESLIEEMLQYARMESARLEPDMQPVVLESWLTGLCERFDLQSEHRVVVSAPNTENEVNLDSHLMERAIGNLVRNADRYTVSDIRLCLSFDDTCWILTVTDDGPGIPAEDALRIFEPFERLDENRARASGGHGLGLAITREIIHLHGGSIELQSIADNKQTGASFRLHIPKAPPIQARPT